MPTKKEAIEPKSKNLTEARRNKNDEFYTLLPDIEKEIANYKEHSKGKSFYCNCDSEVSNFVKYFEQNLDKLQLKEFSHSATDFRDPANLKILEGADIVVTNPPFSLFRSYLATLIEYNKQFLIIGSFNAVTYKETFPLLRDNKMWLGCNPVKEFVIPDGTIKKFGNIVWYTNIPNDKRNKPIKLTKEYYGNEHDYPTYDNYDAIEVSRVAKLPMDYDGIMGVPITFLDKYCPEQFEIIGNELDVGIKGRCKIDGKILYARIFIKKK